MTRVAAIVIGRNEGARLISCLDSLSSVDQIVYVDSGSQDGSIEEAKQRGVTVVELDRELPFTAARARNAGVDALSELGDFTFVQFVDGDCSVVDGWIDEAKSFLLAAPEVAVVCGRRREKFPGATVFNAHCDREWDTPIGETKACGGDSMMRLSAFNDVGGFDPSLIAGEEPELCVRLRAAGWKVHRLATEMTWHDAAISSISQFWKRARRAGHAYAEGAWKHGKPPEAHFVVETRRALVWGALIPFLLVITVLIGGALALVLWAIYPAQIIRLWWREGRDRPAFEAAVLLTISKFAEAFGVAEFHLRRRFGKRARLIEYK